MSNIALFPGLLRIYRGLWHYARGSRGPLCLALTLLALSEGIKLATPWFSGKAIDTLQRQGWSGMADAALLVAAVLGCQCASWLMHGPGRIIERNVSLKVRASFIGDMTARMLHAPLAWHRARHSADSAQRLTQSAEALTMFGQSQYIYLQNAISLFGPIVAICILSPWTGAVAIAGYSLLALISVSFDRVLVAIRAEHLRLERRYYAALSDVLGNVLTLFALRKRSGAGARLDRSLADTFAPQRRDFVYNEAKWATVDLLASVLVYVQVGLYLWLHGRDASLAGGMALGGAFMVYEYARRADLVIAIMVGQFAQLNTQVAGYSTAQALEGIEREPCSEPLRPASPAVWTHLEARGLAHRYTDAAPLVLRDASCTLARGKRYALLGGSGSGKSTLLSLLAGLEEPTQGGIARDGATLSALELRAISTLVPQGVELFEGSLAENLALGANYPAPDMIAALETACARELAADGEADLSRAIDEAGKNWSGGQRQRIAVARGVLAAADCSLLLLDEPGSSLDAATERRLLVQLFKAFPDACIVASIHRPHLIDLFDAAIVVEDGCIADSGSAAELVQSSAPLRRLSCAAAA